MSTDGQSYLEGGAEPHAVGALFVAAAELHRLQPWSRLPDDGFVVEARLSNDPHAYVMYASGDDTRSFSMMLFASGALFDQYLQSADALERGDEPMLPRHLMLTFERGADLSTTMRTEVVRHRWKVAAADAYPLLTTVEANFRSVTPPREAFATIEALCRSLIAVLVGNDHTRPPLNLDAGVSQTLEVKTAAGPLGVTLRG